MVAADDDGGRDLAFGDQVVDQQAKAGPLPIAQPANARRQALEGHTLVGHLDPAHQVLVVGKLARHHFIGHVDVLRVTGEGHPAEGPFAPAEQGPNVGRHKAGVVEGILHAGIKGALAQVVAIVKVDGALALHLEHGRYVRGHRGHRAPRVLGGVAAAQLIGCGQ